MYLLFRYHHKSPHEYFEMGRGEQLVIKSFMHYEIEKRKEEVERLNSMA